MKIKVVKDIDYKLIDCGRTLRFIVPIDIEELKKKYIHKIFDTRENGKIGVITNVTLFDWISVKVYRWIKKLRGKNEKPTN